MSAFDPTNPSKQQYPWVLPTTTLPGPVADSGLIDVTGFRFLVLQGNVVIAGGAGSQVEVDYQFADGTWFNPDGFANLNVVGGFRLFVPQPFPPTVRVRWTLVGVNPQVAMSLLGQS